MATRRMSEIPGFGIDRVARAVGEDPDVLRLENLDTDLTPPASALRATRDAVGQDEANSWLPFTGKADLRRAVADQFAERSGLAVDPDTQVVITYAGMINRVRIAGGVPRLVPLRPESGEWRLDTDALASAVTDRTRAIFVANPGMPTGNHLSDQEGESIASICREREVWLVYLAWMERILFDGRSYRHPTTLDGMADRVVHVGCVTMEQRMIGWRIGWLVVPSELADDAARAHIYNGLTPGGIAQAGAAAALREPLEDVAAATAEWERRRDAILEQLEGLPAVRPAGGWSLLMDVEALGSTPPDLSAALVDQKVAATPMTTWGERVSPRFIRFVYSNEPVERLSLLGECLRRALESQT